MPEKIMFVDDQLAKDPSTIMEIFDCILTSDEKKELKRLREKEAQMGCDIQEIHNALKNNPCLKVFDSFETAVEHISGINDILSEYELFIFDRNLSSSAGGTGGYPSYDESTITAKAKFEFTNNYKNMEGDFLAVQLCTKTLDKEGLFSRLYFYSAYNREAGTPFAATVNNDTFPMDHFIDKDDAGREQLKKLISNSDIPGIFQVRFKYRKIFSNQKIQNLLGKKMEGFIELLARIESAGLTFDEGDGTLLRNMIEGIVALLSGKNEYVSARNFLNDSANGYSIRHLLRPHNICAWVQWYRK